MMAYGISTIVRSVRRGSTTLFISNAIAKPRINSNTSVTTTMKNVVMNASQNRPSPRAVM